MRPAWAWAGAGAIALGAGPAHGDEASEPGQRPVPVAWAADTASPSPMQGMPSDPLARDALARCGAGDERLLTLALGLAERSAAGRAPPELDELDFLRRAAGIPHPWPRAWIARDSAAAAASPASLDAWLRASPVRGTRRCGAATAMRADGRRALAVIAVDALADLAPLPTRARTGEWLTLVATMGAHARAAEVIVLGPGGNPRRVPASLEGSLLQARFAPDRPGEFRVQALAELDEGPRPAVEATVFADAEPPATVADSSAPGEDLAEGLEIRDDAQRLARMLDGARALSGLRALHRDQRLDDLARSHALRMAARRDLAHDAGDGDPLERLNAEGLDAARVGENVAHATTVALAHRALWASPSHRANLLDPSFSRVGVGVARDARGDAWVAELFTSSR